MAGRERNELDVDDYYNLPISDRVKLDEWLEELGGLPTKTRKITLLDSIIQVEEYILNKDNSMTYDWKTKDVVVNRRELPFKERPPVWKPENEQKNPLV